MMEQPLQYARGRNRLSLTVRISLLVLLAALLPLAVVVGIVTYLAQGTLVEQGRAALSTDAGAKATLLDDYMAERVLDGRTLAAVPTTGPFIVCESVSPAPPALGCSSQRALYRDSAGRALFAGIKRDANYDEWTLYTATGTMLLSSNQNATSSTELPVPVADITAIAQQKSSVISNVYYDQNSHRAYINFYTPVTLPDNTYVGFLRSRLFLDKVWSIVQKEQDLNGTGSYAFISDQNGIRIASSKSTELFTAVKSLDPQVQQEITSDKRFGGSGQVQVVDLPQVATALSSDSDEASFQSIADPSAGTQYQFVRVKLKNIPWSYFVLSPISTVTQVATQQVIYSLIAAVVVAVLAVVIGIFIGRRLAIPVQSSVADLEGAAAQLEILATQQNQAAGEQNWVVDACQTGLDSVKYLSDAMHQASRRILDASNWLGSYWSRLNEEQARRTVQHLQELANYIEEAARRQQVSSERLGKAITVTRQVSDQLVGGASAAEQSSYQLEQVVHDLKSVVGGRAPRARRSSDEMDDEEYMDTGEPVRMGAPNSGWDGRSMTGYGPDMGGVLGSPMSGQPGYGGQQMGNGYGSQPAQGRSAPNQMPFPNPPSVWGDLSALGGSPMSGNSGGAYGPPQQGNPFGAPNAPNARSRWGAEPDPRSGWGN